MVTNTIHIINHYYCILLALNVLHNNEQMKSETKIKMTNVKYEIIIWVSILKKRRKIKQMYNHKILLTKDSN